MKNLQNQIDYLKNLSRNPESDADQKTRGQRLSDYAVDMVTAPGTPQGALDNYIRLIRKLHELMPNADANQWAQVSKYIKPAYTNSAKGDVSTLKINMEIVDPTGKATTQQLQATANELGGWTGLNIKVGTDGKHNAMIINGLQ